MPQPILPAPSDDTVLLTSHMEVERKVFVFSLRENKRGRFLLITETDGHRAKIMVPARGLAEFGFMVADALASLQDPTDEE